MVTIRLGYWVLETPESYFQRSLGENFVLYKKVRRQSANKEGNDSAIARPLPEKPQVQLLPIQFLPSNFSIENKTIAMLGLASIILVTLNLLLYWSFIKQKDTAERVNQSWNKLQGLEAVLSTVKDAETGQRGYLLTGQELYLKPYNLAVQTIEEQLTNIQNYPVDHSKQQHQSSQIEQIVRQKLIELKATIELKKKQDSEAAIQLVLTNQGKELMDQLRRLIHQMEKEETAQLQSWLKTKEEESQRGQLIFSGGIVLNLIVFYLVYSAIAQETHDRRKAENSLQQLNQELEVRVQERTAELTEANTNLLHSNRELEQFAYVASHDLQEPLRAVNSYAQLLARKYEGNLDDKADKYLGYIREGATRMQQLITDLLELSRVGTRGRALQPTPCEPVLCRVLEHLQVAIAQSNAIITHDPLPIVMGDETQLIQLFQNLISNAIKFRREQPPQVHICAVQQNNEWVFSVRDNGIGIEAEYFDRIFLIFQRLHGRSEYPGTGIGLAVCKKIVERHGGRIWVESVPDEGTAFYFSLNRVAMGEEK